MRRIFEPDNADTDGSAGGLCFGRCKLYRVVPIFMETGPEMVPWAMVILAVATMTGYGPFENRKKPVRCFGKQSS